LNQKLMPGARERTIETENTQKRMNSRRLQGIQRLTRGLLIQVNIPDDRQTMAEFEADKNPVLKCGPEFLFTSLSVWAWARGNTA